MVTLEKLKKAKIKLPLGKQVESFYKGAHALSQFAESKMMPLLRGQLKPNSKEQGLIVTYYRMWAWLKCMVAMNSSIHFQGAAAAARALFELLLDMELLSRDGTGELVRKFHGFPEAQVFRRAENIVSFTDKYRGKTDIDDTQQRAFIGAKGKRAAILRGVAKVWGTTKKGKPHFADHWSGMSVRRRAETLGLKYRALHVQNYALLSYYVHSGLTGIRGFDEEGILVIFGLSHSLAQKSFLDATIICAREMRLSEAIQGFDRILQEAELAPGKVLMEEQIRIVKEAQAKQEK
jgi:hypothetical protein